MLKESATVNQLARGGPSAGLTLAPAWVGGLALSTPGKQCWTGGVSTVAEKTAS